MRQVTLSDTPNYRLVSYGNGLAYSLAKKETTTDVYFQGDDATQFREELEAMENADPERLTDDILGELWHRYAPDAEPVLVTTP